MSHALAEGPVTIAAPSLGRLYLTELRRFFARRLIKVLLALLVVGYLVAIGGIWQQRHRVTAADRAHAVRARDAQFQQNQLYYARCVQNTAKDKVDEQCGPPPSLDQFASVDFLDVRPFTPNALNSATIALGVGVAAMGFLIASTFIGAEWSSRNIVAWLFWEPRRMRLLGAKILALLSVMLAVSALVQLSWAGIGRLLLHYRGLPISSLGTKSSRFSSDLLLMQVRAGLLVLGFSLLAFCISHLLRNTAAALGFGFLYFAVVENAVRILHPAWQPFLLSVNTGAWLSTGGSRVPARAIRQTHR